MPISRVVSRTALAAALVFVPSSAPRMAKVMLEPAPPFAYLGEVALDDVHLAVGAPGVRGLSGAVFVFDRATRALLHSVALPDGARHEYFGQAVALHDGVLAAGAPERDDVGWAGLFDASTGTGPLALVQPSPFLGERFGAALDVDGLRAAVGAPGNLVFPANDGRVVLFARDTGAPLHDIPSPLPGRTPLGGNAFGSAVALDAGRLLVGAPGTANEGRAWMYDASSAQLAFELEPPPGFAPRYLGAGVALGGGRAAVGDPQTGDGRGAVHVYDAASGVYLYSVVPDADVIGGFGTHVALDDERLVVGAQWETHDAGTGVVRVYDAHDGALLDVLVGRPAATSSRFGISLDLEGGVLAVGDNEDGQAATYAGAAYLVDVGR
ncbi:MAG: hypothetical protein H6825_06925 [Planctomycetes bacterium]|nr:hypothetical protein [Planctomycetota bacterium]